MNDCPFHKGDRVLAPAHLGPTLEPGTVRARRKHQIGPTLEGHTEAHIQVLVEFDEKAFGTNWVLCQACKPLDEA